MTAGLAVTGVVSYLLVGAIKSGNPLVLSDGVSSPLAYIIMFAPLGLIFWMGARMHKMTANAAQKTHFGYFQLVYGVSLSSISSVYTNITIVRVFLICSSMFLTMTTYGYTTKKSWWLTWVISNDGSYWTNYSKYCKFIYGKYYDAFYYINYRCVNFCWINCIPIHKLLKKFMLKMKIVKN